MARATGIISVVKYHLITYGCQMNTADSQEMSQPLKDRGLIPTQEIGQADVVIMNTCTVREHAEHKAISNLGRLRTWKQKNPDRILVVAGCAASLWGESLKKKYPYVDLVSPATQIENFPDAIAKVLKERWNCVVESKTAFGALNDVQDLERRSDSGTTFLFGGENTAYVTIMRGCNLNCSYCIVPQVRGREKYRPLPEILGEIHQRVKEGYKEVMLLGQTVNSYFYRSADSTVIDFADLLRAVHAIEGVESIRFMSPHPKHMRSRVIEAITECSKVARHVHLPVQSGSNRLLARMKRLYTREEYICIVHQLRSAVPGMAITTDIIVGFPGETTADFEETLSLLDELRFSSLFAFKYSPRPGTASANETDDVPDPLKEERLQNVLERAQSW